MVNGFYNRYVEHKIVMGVVAWTLMLEVNLNIFRNKILWVFEVTEFQKLK